jgi:putative transposase
MWHRLYYHLVWTTEARTPLLDKECAEFLRRYVRAAAGHYRATVLEIGAVRSHVHSLIVAHPMTDLSRMIGHIKGGSATVWNKDYAEMAGWKLKWASGYGLSTVSPRQLDAVRRYLRAQPIHHPSERIEGWDGDRPSHESMR